MPLPSYDVWAAEMTTDPDPDQNEEPEGPWEVTARWLFDLDVYNEWMNEEDYLVVDDEGNVCIHPSPLYLVRSFNTLVEVFQGKWMPSI